MNKTLFKILLLCFCLLLAGPELAIGLELFGVLNLMSLEIFLLVLSVPFLYYSQLVVFALYRVDPYFFLSPKQDIRACPALIAHAIPFFVLGLFIFINSAVLSFFRGD